MACCYRLPVRAPTLAASAFPLLSGTLQIGHSLGPFCLVCRGDNRFERVAVHPTPLAIVRTYERKRAVGPYDADHRTFRQREYGLTNGYRRNPRVGRLRRDDRAIEFSPADSDGGERTQH